ncbi:hypothetical protein BKA64DRAFT_637873 [Cadophora sp. MPI-SDFR-AT-0126]|nr:hypothetical protein BKA64DRAFT_637873 [Leotiomycetes sp. MPI-SDFR-AT-0126]
MTPTNDKAVAEREWILDGSGRWTLNPAVNHITKDMKMCLKNLEKFDEGWEFFGLEAIRQFYYFIHEVNDNDECLFRIHENAFSVPDQDHDKIDAVMGKLGLDKVKRDFAKTLQGYRKLLGPSTLSHKKQILQKFRKSSTKHVVSEMPNGARFNANKLNTRLAYLTLKYFARGLESSGQIQGLDVVGQMPVDAFSGLPAELRLQILEKLSLAEMDYAFRSSFQDLVRLYLPTVQLKAKQWYANLFSRSNFVYAGISREEPGEVTPNALPCDVYRLRYPNLHPELQPRKYHPDHQHQAFNLEMDMLQYAPSLSHAGLLLMDALEQILWHRFQPASKIRNRDKIWQTNARPRALSFYMEPDIFEERDDPTVSIVHQEVVQRDAHLIIYQDELNLILDDLEPFLRPAFLKRQMTAAFRETDEDFAYIFPSPEFEKIVPERPTLQEHKYGYSHMKIGTAISRGTWDITSMKKVEHNLMTEDEWRFWWDFDRKRQEEEDGQGRRKGKGKGMGMGSEKVEEA